MAQWQADVEFFQNNTRVPRLEYFRTVPRLKPLGSAVTSVFVSTFAMLSVIWTVFSLVAGALARFHSVRFLDLIQVIEAPNGDLEDKNTLGQFRKEAIEMQELEESQVSLLGEKREPDAVKRWRERIDKEGVQMRAALVRMSAALKKHGIMEDENWEDMRVD
ncbi:hypothetical protein C8R45DRAFT_931309 [Mycena sanguinolenta]|nr:hypothetical protein C8R45DRAFT_931309 [Mycena sanguinolenta]